MLTVLPPKRILFGYCHICVYQANTTNYTGIYANETTYPEARFIVAVDFNKANLRKTLMRYYHHIDYSTRTGKTLDHEYTDLVSSSGSV